MQALADSALIKPVIDAYWMICGRYAAPTEDQIGSDISQRGRAVRWYRSP